VDLFTSFGESDLSADVDFRLLTNVAIQSQLFASSTKTQRDFLKALGAEVLLMQLLKNNILNNLFIFFFIFF
jgi:SAM-dependent MidA family methyltransferase